MAMHALLLPELDHELAKTRTTLERVPSGKDGFAPHPKSMPLGMLAAHVAQLTEIGLSVLSSDAVDFSDGSFVPLKFESAAQLVTVLDEGGANVREALQRVPDASWNDTWTLSFQGGTLFKGARFVAYRELFLNHLVHHRAQLGVYLRLTGDSVPATYGPSADDRQAF